MSDLLSLLQAGDSGAVSQAKEEGERALETIAPFLDDEDADRRFLAVECVAAAGGSRAAALLLGKVQDEDREVRLEATAGLRRCAPEGLEQEVGVAFDTSDDPLVRKRLALVLGELGTAAAQNKLAHRIEAFDPIQDGLVAAAARSGDPRSRARLGFLIAEARGERVQEVLALWTYAGAEDEHLHQLRPLLDRFEPALLAPTHHSEFSRRGCDLAIDLVLEHQPKNTFIFDPKPGYHYPPHEVDEVRAFLDSLGPVVD